jgi:CO dehydrogenase/acetyl-CoA synthase beta subunit
MPTMLKEEIGPRLREKLAKEGVPELYEKIADEEKAKTIQELAEFLGRVGHPALEMKPLI